MDGAYAEIMGLSVEATWDWIQDRFRLDISQRRFWQAYTDEKLRLLERPVEPIAGVRNLIAELQRLSVPIAVASSSLRRWVDATLNAIGLAGAFGAVVTASEVEYGKPAPDVFLAAASLLGAAPGDCLVIEDTPAGVASAKAAGMFAVQLRAASTAPPPIAEADSVIDSFADFDLSLLAQPTPEVHS
jgi:HAD superfamily hydrolase (TIGR01509 family)